MTPWTAARWASLPLNTSQSLLKPTSMESVMPSNQLTLCRPLFLLPSIFQVIQTVTRAQLRVRVYVSTRTLFPPFRHFVLLLSVSLWKHISTQLAGQGLATGHGPWWLESPVWSQHPHCRGLSSVSGREPKPCLKPLQAEAIQDQWETSRPQSCHHKKTGR